MRASNELKDACRKVMIDSVKEVSPGLRDAIRDALEKGAKPAELRRRYGLTRKRINLTACAVEWIIDEWEREHGKTGSIDD